MDMAPGCTDRSIQADDLTMLSNFANTDTTGISHSAGGYAPHATEHDTCPNILFPANLPDGIQQVFSAFETDTVTNQFSPAADCSCFHIDFSLKETDLAGIRQTAKGTGILQHLNMGL